MVIYDGDGVAYTVIIGYNQDDFTKGGLFVARSTDDGATWSTPVATANHGKIAADPKCFNDKEWMTVDRSSTARTGHTVPHLDPLHHHLEHREDRGDIVADPLDRRRADLERRGADEPRGRTEDASAGVLPGGRAERRPLRALLRPDQQVPQLWLGRSTDGGKTFAPPVQVADVRRPPRRCPAAASACSSSRTLGGQPGGRRAGGDLERLPEQQPIVLATPRATRAKPGARRCASTTDTTSADQFFPTAVFGPDGVLHLAWLDRRDDPKNLTFSTLLHPVHRRRAQLRPEVRISDAQSDPSVGFERHADRRLYPGGRGGRAGLGGLD